MQEVFMKFSVALKTRMGHRVVRVLFPVGIRNISLPHNVHTDYGAHPAPCVTVPEILYPVVGRPGHEASHLSPTNFDGKIDHVARML
jgi:hypothetical protein